MQFPFVKTVDVDFYLAIITPAKIVKYMTTIERLRNAIRNNEDPQIISALTKRAGFIADNLKHYTQNELGFIQWICPVCGHPETENNISVHKDYNYHEEINGRKYNLFLCTKCNLSHLWSSPTSTENAALRPEYIQKIWKSEGTD